MSKQVKADLRDILDDHHRLHHNDWLTVVDSETTTAAPRLVCRCSHGYTVWADAGCVTKTREAPATPTLSHLVRPLSTRRKPK